MTNRILMVHNANIDVIDDYLRSNTSKKTLIKVGRLLGKMGW